MDFAGLWDRALLLTINGYSHRSLIFDIAIYNLGDFLSGGILFVFVWWLWFRRNDEPTGHNRLMAIRSVIGIGVAICVSRVLQTSLPKRLRPIHDPTVPLTVPFGVPSDMPEHWSSLPSDHAVVFFAMATVIWLNSRWLGAGAFLWALVLGCLPRIYYGAHYPSDIILGAMIGLVITALAFIVPLPWFVFERPLNWERRRPEIFYSFAVILTYEYVTLGSDLRHLATAVYRFVF